MNKNYIPEWPPESDSEFYEYNLEQKKVKVNSISYEWPPEPLSEITKNKKIYIENYEPSNCGALCLTEIDKIYYKEIKWFNNDHSGHCF